MYTVYDNILPKQFYKNLCGIVENPYMEWYYDYTAYTKNNMIINDNDHIFKYSWGQTVYYFENNQRTRIFEPFYNSLLLILDSIDKELDFLYRIRIGLVTATHKSIMHEPHVDLMTKHNTALLYLNVTDGDTVIYNEKYDYNSNMDTMDYYNDVLCKNLSVADRVEPKLNRVVIFDGEHYHNSSTPTRHAKRIAVNFNYTVK